MESKEVDIPDGDVNQGKKLFQSTCNGCHDLDHDNYIGPAIRSVYLRRFGARK